MVAAVATPSVFISSTFYDLRYIRENLLFFVRSLGYNPILSEKGTIFFDPQRDAADAAVAEVPNCQMFVLVIGGRFGSELLDSGRSVTNAEYQQAIRMRIPVFALVEQGAYSDFEVWQANRGVDALGSIVFPNADDPRIFEFIEEVRSQAVNNALTPFHDFADIENYLKSQWASLLHSFLADVNEEKRVAETLSGLERVSERVEILSRQILESVGTTEAKLMADLYDYMLGSSMVQNLTGFDLRPKPTDILRYDNFFDCAQALGGTWEVDQDQGPGASATRTLNKGTMSPEFAENAERAYQELREILQGKLDESGLTLSTLEARVGANDAEPEAGAG
jgi:Domain of unknown function (DUF4062)